MWDVNMISKTSLIRVGLALKMADEIKVDKERLIETNTNS